MNNKSFKTVLTIAGSDSMGGAGIEADIKTCNCFDIYAMTAITALTAQNSLGITDIAVTSPDFLRIVIDTVVSDRRPDAVKIGMLPSAAHVRVVADAISRWNLRNIVVDPVVKSTSGSSLTGNSKDTALAMLKYLFPVSDIVTPNIPESKFFYNLFNDIDVECRNENENSDPIPDELPGIFGCNAILLKGGHSEEGACDLLICRDDKGIIHKMFFNGERIESRNLHGTGCTLSSAIACGLARNLSVVDAVSDAKSFITNAIQSGAEYCEFKGNGPLYLFK